MLGCSANKHRESLSGLSANRRSIEQRDAGRQGENEYLFYDGPPFANGLPHYGHLLTGYVKDVVPRYQAMRGKRVERRFGWDCHGLPAEMAAEQELKKDGLETGRYGNGQKRCEYIWKDGNLVTATVWKPNGEKCPDTNLKKGNGGPAAWTRPGCLRGQQLPISVLAGTIHYAQSVLCHINIHNCM